MNFTERQNISKQLDDIQPILRENIQKLRKRNDRLTNRTHFSIFRPFFSYYKLLGKEYINNSDIKFKDENLSLPLLYNEVQTTIDNSILKASFKTYSVTSIFGQYGTIIKKMNLKNVWKLYMIDTIVMILTSTGSTMIIRYYTWDLWFEIGRAHV